MAEVQSSLVRFSIPPQRGAITVCEREGRFLYANQDENGILEGLEDAIPSEIHIDDPGPSGDISTSFSLPFTNESAFHPVHESPLKAAWLTWRDQGTWKLLESLGEEEGSDEGASGSGVSRAASCVLKCLRQCHNIYSVVTLQPKKANHEELCESFAQVSQWSDSQIRALTVHPHLKVVAIARKDDFVEVRDIAKGSNINNNLLLKDRLQICITCLQWASHSNTLLGVGVLGGVLLWHIDITRPNAKHPSTFLPCFDSQLVVALSWCPKGRLLACGTPTNSTLLVWDVPLMSSTSLKRVHGGGVASLNWSPSGDKLFVAHVSPLCRVWESRQWTCDKWTNLAGRCKASCWSPGGQYLLVTMEDDPSLYYMTFKGRHQTALGGSGVSAAVKCADLTECCLGDDPDDRSSWTGGLVQGLSWDWTGERLAVLFSSGSAGVGRVAVFYTQCDPVLELFPGGFVQGKEGEVPIWVEFARCFSQTSVLVTGWDSGRVSFTPMNYSSAHHQHLLPPESISMSHNQLLQAPPTSSLYTRLL